MGPLELFGNLRTDGITGWKSLAVVAEVCHAW